MIATLQSMMNFPVVLANALDVEENFADALCAKSQRLNSLHLEGGSQGRKVRQILPATSVLGEMDQL
ncbi:hypothetical protein SCA6_015583 [Theobroma cacao]